MRLLCGYAPGACYALGLVCLLPVSAPDLLLQSATRGTISCQSLAINKKLHPHTFYQAFDDRCEGVYVRNQSHSAEQGPLTLMFLGSRPRDARPLGEKATLTWKPFSSETPLEIHVADDRVEADVRYRLDTYQPTLRGRFQWPATILSSASLGLSQLAVSVSVRQTIGLLPETVYVPVELYSLQPSPAPQLTVEVAARESLSSLSFDLLRYPENSGRIETIRSAEQVQGVGAIRQSPVVVSVPVTNVAGRYRMMFRGSTVTGASVSLSFYFLHHVG